MRELQNEHHMKSLGLQVAAAGYDRQGVTDHAQNLASKIRNNGHINTVGSVGSLKHLEVSSFAYNPFSSVANAHSMVGLTEPQAREKAEKEEFEISTSFEDYTKALAENEGEAAGSDRQGVTDHAQNLASKIRNNLTNSKKSLGVDILTLFPVLCVVGPLKVKYGKAGGIEIVITPKT
ncbi:hypothetical protein L1887_04673 [Cichorium endivia]|nr:hypothetical protein L1887_04673 [Cichorium endivia]